MRTLHYILAVGLVALMLLNSVPAVTAGGGPSPTEPIYVSTESPDLPFEEFTNGKIGIVRSSFGRKTLFIAYRYLNDGSFTTEEQNDLIKALKGTAPEENGSEALKAWIDGRKQFVKENEKLPEIYTERSYGGYDFFPNCTKNAFEVALQTLKDRAASYGAEDANVRAWLAAQDTVFRNCSEGTQFPMELGPESPTWLRKDRDYQIAAAHFYSLRFDEARARFEKIAADPDSPWQELAGYLVARTLIRKGSLGENEKRKQELFEKAESRLQTLVMSGGKYAGASKKLLALVKYHIHPEERVVELSRTLTAGSNENLRQDLIDYVWLLDKFESRILKAEEERKKKAEGPAGDIRFYAPFISKEAAERYERLERGEIIDITLYQNGPDNTPDYSQRTAVEFKHDASEAEILGGFEQTLGRKLTDEETKQIKLGHEFALIHRRWRISPNRKWYRGGLSQYEGCHYDCGRLSFDLLPDFLRADDLSNWILTIQTRDANAYSRAFAKWRETGSPAWMLAALVKAETSSPRLARLIQAAEKVTRDERAFPTVAYHLIRLKVAMGHTDQARTLLDEIISWQSGVLPVSAQNQFLEQRMHLASGLDEFLKSAQRKPLAFYEYGAYGKLSDLLTVKKSFWNPKFNPQTREEYERDVDESYKDLLPWEDRFGFDYRTTNIFDWHFPLQVLVEAARNPNVPDYLQRSLLLAAWTRAVLLDNDDIALRIAPEVVEAEPRMAVVFEEYLKSRTSKERRNAALYVLLKFPNLSPFVQGGLPSFSTSEEIDYYFEDSWWCSPSDKEYNDEGDEAPKLVPKPNFLSAAQLETASRERRALLALGDAKSYLGKRVIEWTSTSPGDARIPEMLFIAAQANARYKYGCNGWEFDEKTKEEAEKILRQRYHESPWTAKLSQPQN